MITTYSYSCNHFQNARSSRQAVQRSTKTTGKVTQVLHANSKMLRTDEKKARHDHFACTLPLSQRTHAKMARMRNAEHLSAHCSADATVNASRTKHTQDQCKRCSVSSVILKSRCALTKYIKLRFFAILQTLIPHRISTEQSSRKSYNNTECHHYHAKPCAN
jgi:hypothetical protein